MKHIRIDSAIDVSWKLEIKLRYHQILITQIIIMF
jgi:hypothetical protein